MKSRTLQLLPTYNAIRLISTLGVAIAAGALVGALAGQRYQWILPIAIAPVLVAPIALARPQILLYGGILVTSFDRILTVEIANLTLKPSYALFTCALAGCISAAVTMRDDRPSPIKGVPWLLSISVLGFLVLHVISSLAATMLLPGLKQLAVFVVGGIVPALAIVLIVRSRHELRCVITCFIIAQMAVASFGLYQLIAIYFGLPQGIPYTGVLFGAGRISAFSYEPAFYGAYVLTCLPLVLSDAIDGRRRTPLSATVPAAFLLIICVLVNSRAAYIALPFVLIGLAFIYNGFTFVPRLVYRLIPSLIMFVPLLALLFIYLQFNPLSFASDILTSIVDTNDTASAGPRLTLYDAVLDLISHNWLFGVGPGNLGYFLDGSLGRVFGVPNLHGHEYLATANNIWLQAAVDSGVMSSIFVTGILCSIFSLVRRPSNTTARALALGALVVLLINGIFVSFLWDVKIWTVIGLAIAARGPAADT